MVSGGILEGHAHPHNQHPHFGGEPGERARGPGEFAAVGSFAQGRGGANEGAKSFWAHVQQEPLASQRLPLTAARQRLPTGEQVSAGRINTFEERLADSHARIEEQTARRIEKEMAAEEAAQVAYVHRHRASQHHRLDTVRKAREDVEDALRLATPRSAVGPSALYPPDLFLSAEDRGGISHFEALHAGARFGDDSPESLRASAVSVGPSCGFEVALGAPGR